MNHLYPSVTRTRLYAQAIALVILFLIKSLVARPQSLNFNNPVLESGTAQQAGAVYRFNAVTTNGNIDALIKVDSLINMTLSDIDATPSGSSTTAFQPQLNSPGGIGYHYAVFTITFVNHGTTTPTPIFDFSSVFMGIDGSNQMAEFNAITVSNASWKYLSPTPKVAVTQTGDLVWGTATSSDPTGGQGVDETDSTEMFKVSSPATASVTLRVGYNQTKHGWSGNDLFSVNISGGELAAITLPVTLLSFTAQLVNDKVSLAWSTSREENMSYYSIERSYDNKTFDEAALIFTADNPLPVNNYSYKDPVKNVTGSMIFYRLKMVDKNGKYTYSEVRSVRLGNATDSERIAVYPNPVANELHISLPAGWQNKSLNGQLLSLAGNIIKTFNIQQSATIGMADVPAGTYYLKVVNGKEISTQTIVKSRN